MKSIIKAIHKNKLDDLRKLLITIQMNEIPVIVRNIPSNHIVTLTNNIVKMIHNMNSPEDEAYFIQWLKAIMMCHWSVIHSSMLKDEVVSIILNWINDRKNAIGLLESLNAKLDYLDFSIDKKY